MQLTLGEMNEWARTGTDDLYIDESLMDLSPAHTRMWVNQPEGKPKYVNFLHPHTFNRNTVSQIRDKIIPDIKAWRIDYL
ncbi:hypothetical protein MNBD_BACTEROID03-530 [hydrothermal vent metagenome]|uniref:Uncharacterized protein n=1 Tax=hydrothermal vent metagenome TaxID=652676 RepID=A0A3B0SWA3_9ZZZZ